jgi:hypothetical protein
VDEDIEAGGAAERVERDANLGSPVCGLKEAEHAHHHLPGITPAHPNTKTYVYPIVKLHPNYCDPGVPSTRCILANSASSCHLLDAPVVGVVEQHLLSA